MSQKPGKWEGLSQQEDLAQNLCKNLNVQTGDPLWRPRKGAAKSKKVIYVHHVFFTVQCNTTYNHIYCIFKACRETVFLNYESARGLINSKDGKGNIILPTAGNCVHTVQ